MIMLYSWSFSTFFMLICFLFLEYCLTQSICWVNTFVSFNIPTWFNKTFANLYSIFKKYVSMKYINLAHAVEALAQHLSPPFRTQALLELPGILPGLFTVESLSRNFSEGSCFIQYLAPSPGAPCIQWLICFGPQMPGSLFMTENSSECLYLLSSPS